MVRMGRDLNIPNILLTYIPICTLIAIGYMLTNFLINQQNVDAK